MSPLPFDCDCCVSDWRDWKRGVAATPIGGDTPTFARRECERPDCKLYEAILQRMEDTDATWLAHKLRMLRERMMRRPAGEVERDWAKRQELLEEAKEAHLNPPKPMAGESWDHRIPQVVAEALEDFDEDRTAWLKLQSTWESARRAKKQIVALCGPSRIGKTCAAAHWLAAYDGGRFVLSSHVSSLREAATTSGDRSELEVLKRACAVVIDDVGRAGETDADRSRVADLVRAREAKGLPTTLTMMTGRDLHASLTKRSQIVIAF